MIGHLVTAWDNTGRAGEELTWLFDTKDAADAKQLELKKRFDHVDNLPFDCASKDHFLDEQEKYARLRAATLERWHSDRLENAI